MALAVAVVTARERLAAAPIQPQAEWLRPLVQLGQGGRPTWRNRTERIRVGLVTVEDVYRALGLIFMVPRGGD